MVADEFQRITGREVLDQADIVLFEAIIESDIQRISNIARQSGFNIRAEIIKTAVLGQDPDLEALNTQTGRTASNIRTELNTAFSSFNRAATVLKAVDLFGPNPRFIYLGPDDKVTRPFCDQVLAGNVSSEFGNVPDREIPIYSLSEINQLNNGQSLSVLTSGGGFNCRHDWRPVTEELEASL